MKFLVLLISFVFSLQLQAKECSLKLAKDVAKGVFVTELENNESLGKVSFQIKNKTYEYTPDIIADNIKSSSSKKVDEKLESMADFLESSDKNHLYRVVMRNMQGQGSCNTSATCTGNSLLVFAKESVGQTSSHCYIQKVEFFRDPRI